MFSFSFFFGEKSFPEQDSAKGLRWCPSVRYTDHEEKPFLPGRYAGCEGSEFALNGARTGWLKVWITEAALQCSVRFVSDLHQAFPRGH